MRTLNLFRVYLLIGFLAMMPQAANAIDVLYPLLVANIAESRGLKQIAFEEYLNVIRLTKDPRLAEESTLLAIKAQDHKAAIELSAQWALYDQNNLEAQIIASILHLEQSADQGMPYLNRAIAIDPRKTTESLAEISSMLSDHGLQHLRSATLNLARLKPFDANTQLIAAWSAAAVSDTRSAYRLVNAALEHQPHLTEAILLKARLIQYEDNSPRAALGYLKKQVEALPMDAKLRFVYADALMEDQHVDEGLRQFKQLLRDPYYGGFSAIAMGDYYLQAHQMSEATKAFEQALAFENAASSAQYILGTVAEQENQHKQALQWYLKVGTGPYHIAARLKVIDFLKADKAFEEAMDYLDESDPQTLDEQKQLLLRKVELLQLIHHDEEAITLAHKLLENLPDDPDVMETLQGLNIPLQASD